MFPFQDAAANLDELIEAAEPKDFERAIGRLWRHFGAVEPAPANSRPTAARSLLVLAARLSGPSLYAVGPAEAMPAAAAIAELRRPEHRQAATLPAGMNPLPIVFALVRVASELLADAA